MDVFPFNLILAVATASTTIFLGFLPTKTVSSIFFGQESAKAIFAWGFVALGCPAKIVHYPLILAFFCFAAWWNFRRDKALSGKMWLSLASGLGISIGVMLILAVTPAAIPAGLSQFNETLLLASIYLGGAIIGLAYVCLTLVLGMKSGINNNLVQRYVGLLFGLCLVRAAVLFTSIASISRITGPIQSYDNASPALLNLVRSTTHDELETLIVLALALLLPGLAFLAQRASGFASRIQPTKYLVAIICVGFLTEVLARLLVL